MGWSSGKSEFSEYSEYSEDKNPTRFSFSILQGSPMSYSQHAISYILPASFFAVTEKLHTFANEKLHGMKKHLVISTSLDLVRIAPEYVVYIASDGNYSTLVQRDGEVRMVSYQLGQIEKMISDQLGTEGNIFIRIGKSLIINRNFIYYINIPKQKLILSDACSVNHTVTASKEALKQLKELIEQEGKL